jgi:hypothetical protein
MDFLVPDSLFTHGISNSLHGRSQVNENEL